ncbi:MAG: peroxiredoxin [Novosphingobium sp.]
MTIAPGDTLPDLTLTAPDGTPVRLADFTGHKLVLFFYPKDDTPGCTTENIDFSALADDFAKARTALLGISKDPPKKHQKFIAKHGLTAPLASDAETEGLSDVLGFWTEKSMYGRSYLGMVRSTVLVGTDGKVALVWSPVKVKGHAAEVLKAAQAL